LRGDPRFVRGLSGVTPPPGGLCIASTDPDHLLDCSSHDPGNCSLANKQDLCGSRAFGGETFNRLRGGPQIIKGR